MSLVYRVCLFAYGGGCCVVNSFGDDDGLQQARSRRRFQTGLLIFLLLFFMDAKTPQETQNQHKRNAQVGACGRVIVCDCV